MTARVRWCKPLLFRRERTRRHPGGSSLIEGGLVRRGGLPYLLDAATEQRVGNTRVISQTALDHFRTSLSTKQHDPYSVLLRRNKLPMALLDDASNSNLRKVRDQCRN